MKMKGNPGFGLTIPKRVRIAGMTFYMRNGQVIGRESETHEKRSNTLPQFVQRQKMRHTTMLWKMLRFCDTMFTERRTAYQNFSSLANQLPVVYVPDVCRRYEGVGSGKGDGRPLFAANNRNPLHFVSTIHDRGCLGSGC